MPDDGMFTCFIRYQMAVHSLRVLLRICTRLKAGGVIPALWAERQPRRSSSDKSIMEVAARRSSIFAG
jgi:hypothetical protein